MLKSQEIRISEFSRKYSSDAKKWGENIGASGSSILAISRKSPRLIELLVRDKILAPQILSSVFSEHSIPYITPNIKKIKVVDDSVLYGSTITNVLKKINEVGDGSKKQIEVTPFKYSINTPSRVKEIIDRNVATPILENEIPNYVGSLISSFKLLGKPYDVEHPILYVYGDFSDLEMVDLKFQTIANDFETISYIKNSNGSYLDSYTLLFKEDDSCGNKSILTKFRFFINEEKNRLSIVPIALRNLSESDVNNMASDNAYLNSLWEKLYGAFMKNESKKSSSRSLVVFINYFYSLSFFQEHRCLLENYFDLTNLHVDKFDLQLIVGLELSSDFRKNVTKIISSRKLFNLTIKGNGQNNLKSNIIPKEYEDDYNKYLDEQLEKSFSVYDIVSTIFYCQHAKLEIPTRKDENYNQESRLKFGVTFKSIEEIVRNRTKENVEVNELHRVLDSLIDSGNVVPKYMNISNSESKVWGRGFRVGECSSKATQRSLLIIKLLKNLSEFFEDKHIPAILLEKYLVLTLSDSFGFEDLDRKPISGLGIFIKYDKYGARSCFTEGNENSYFLEWAKDRGLIFQNPKSKKYHIAKDISENYDLNELDIVKSLDYNFKDLAEFCKVVGDQELLVAITSLGSSSEYWKALSAELRLWLYHRKHNIYNCLNELLYLEKNNTAKLESVNETLYENANFTAQVTLKKELYNDFDNVILNIDKRVKEYDKRIVGRIWDTLREKIKIRKISDSKESDLNELIITLRIAHIVSSACRTFLTKAGFKTDEKHKDKTISFRLESILNVIEASNDRNDEHYSHLLYGVFQKSQVIKNIKILLIDLNKHEDTLSYDELIKRCYRVFVHVADTCDECYSLFADIEHKSKSLENNSFQTLPPPQYLVMWDVIGSTSIEDRVGLEQNVLFPITEKINLILKEEVVTLSADDGNFAIVENFMDVLSIFSIIKSCSTENNVRFRIGCDVNFQGELRYYPNRKIHAGREFEVVSRTTNFYKEISNDDSTWTSKKPVIEPDRTYLIITEFVKRIAESNNDWEISNDYTLEELPGTYQPRLRKNSVIPYKVFTIT
ncbi:MAG: hypothetical protein WD048_13140 [Chitinophagales bacterium]